MCYFGAHAKIGNPTTTPSGVLNNGTKRKKEINIAINPGPQTKGAIYGSEISHITTEKLGEMFIGDFVNTYAEKFLLMLMGGRERKLARAKCVSGAT